ncbi:MAG: hypothetical protein NW205_06625 [Hyphomicrobiaceae bacterium]|nr:hypothetical protein [Hyphomicrobiaceae bacterium]
MTGLRTTPAAHAERGFDDSEPLTSLEATTAALRHASEQIRALALSQVAAPVPPAAGMDFEPVLPGDRFVEAVAAAVAEADHLAHPSEPVVMGPAAVAATLGVGSAPHAAETDEARLPSLFRDGVRAAGEVGVEPGPLRQMKIKAVTDNPHRTSLIGACGLPLVQVAAVGALLVGAYVAATQLGDTHAQRFARATPAFATADAGTAPATLAPIVRPRGIHNADLAEAEAMPRERATAASEPTREITTGSDSALQRLPVEAGAVLSLADTAGLSSEPGLAVLIVRGLPRDYVLRGGVRAADGGVVVAAENLPEATIAVPVDAAGGIDLDIEAVDVAARTILRQQRALDVSPVAFAEALPHDRLRALVGKGEARLAEGDIPAARLLLLRAALAGDKEAARLLAKTYNPVVLAEAGAGWTEGDPVRAVYWQAQAERAAQTGATRSP